jgi:hypothetical protein
MSPDPMRLYDGLLAHLPPLGEHGPAVSPIYSIGIGESFDTGWLRVVELDYDMGHAWRDVRDGLALEVDLLLHRRLCGATKPNGRPGACDRRLGHSGQHKRRRALSPWRRRAVDAAGETADA